MPVPPRASLRHGSILEPENTHVAGGSAWFTAGHEGSLMRNLQGLSNQDVAHELGRERDIRVNEISTGPVQTLSAAGVADFDKIMRH